MPVRPLTPGGPRSSPPARAGGSQPGGAEQGGDPGKTPVRRAAYAEGGVWRSPFPGGQRERRREGGRAAPTSLLSARPPPPSLAPPSLAPAFCAPEPGRQRAPTAAALTGAPGHRLRERRCREGGSSSRGCSRNQGAARHRRARTHTTHTQTERGPARARGPPLQLFSALHHAPLQAAPARCSLRGDSPPPPRAPLQRATGTRLTAPPPAVT